MINTLNATFGSVTAAIEGFGTKAYRVTSIKAPWLITCSKTVASVVSSFFTRIGSYLAPARDAVISGLNILKNKIATLPKEAKIASAVCLAALVIGLGVAAYKKCASKKTVPPLVVTEQVTVVVDAAATGMNAATNPTT